MGGEISKFKIQSSNEFQMTNDKKPVGWVKPTRVYFLFSLCAFASLREIAFILLCAFARNNNKE